MKKYLVIGNPIEHSLSPVIHNYWMKKYNLTDSIYEKRKIEKKKMESAGRGPPHCLLTGLFAISGSSGKALGFPASFRSIFRTKFPEKIAGNSFKAPLKSFKGP